MKISVNCGHTVKGAGYGAVSGKFKESQITRAVGNEVIRLLKEKGHEVHNSTVNYADSQNAYLKRVVEMVNIKTPDLFVSIHCNASSSHTGHGVEVYTYNGKKFPAAENICKNVSKLGFKNRGIKDGSHLYVIKNTKPRAVLVELLFLDNPTDQELYTKHRAEVIARAIADGI